MPTSAEMDALVTQVNDTVGVINSAIVFLNGLQDLITTAAGDRAKSLELADLVGAKKQELADALAANPGPTPPTP